MSTLEEMAVGYEESATLLRARLKQIRAAMMATSDPEELWLLKRRQAELTPMLTQMNELRDLCLHYYTQPRSHKYTFAGGTKVVRSWENM